MGSPSSSRRDSTISLAMLIYVSMVFGRKVSFISLTSPRSAVLPTLQSLIGTIGLCVPEQENQTLLRGLVVLSSQAAYRGLEPVVLSCRQEHVHEGIILSQSEHVLRNKDLEVGL